MRAVIDYSVSGYISRGYRDRFTFFESRWCRGLFFHAWRGFFVGVLESTYGLFCYFYERDYRVSWSYSLWEVLISEYVWYHPFSLEWFSIQVLEWDGISFVIGCIILLPYLEHLEALTDSIVESFLDFLFVMHITFEVLWNNLQFRILPSQNLSDHRVSIQNIAFVFFYTHMARNLQ